VRYLLYIITLTTFLFSTVTDIDGNVYETVIIGPQNWMAENLKVTHFRNGDDIPNFAPYNNNESYVDDYGYLYAWNDVIEVQYELGLCPEGWHVATQEDYFVLFDSMAGSDHGSQMKSVGFGDDATNESGFSALPGGRKDYWGDFVEIGESAWFWTSTTRFFNNSSWYVALFENSTGAQVNSNWRHEYHSIRCVEDIYGCTDVDACNHNSAAAFDDGTCLYFDECGECGGDGVDEDNDGLCDDVDTCFGVYDCWDICDGGAVIDLCGQCGGDNSTCTHNGNRSTVSLGTYNVVGILSDGTPITWGHDYNQIPEDINDVVAVSNADTFELMLLSDSTIVTTGGSSYPGAPEGLDQVIEISTSRSHSLALKSDGTVVAWGRDDYGQSTVPDGIENVIAVDAGGYFSLVLFSDGTVFCWGENDYGQCNVPPGLDNVIAISGGGLHSLALLSDGTVVSWGRNQWGESNVSGLEDVVSISAGQYHSLYRLSDGSAIARGHNTWGQSSVPDGIENVVGVKAGFFHSLALHQDGSLTIWGDSNNEYPEIYDVPVGSEFLVFCEADECGECFGPGFDCNGECYGVIEDCAGMCGGAAEFDECGICDGGNTSCSDCCGEIYGDGTSCYTDFVWDDGSNCSTVPGGPACDATGEQCNCDGFVWNCIGQCVNPESLGVFVDCEGICNGSVGPDECGVCYGDNTSCTDCCGEINGDGTSCYTDFVWDDGNFNLADGNICDPVPGGPACDATGEQCNCDGFVWNCIGQCVNPESLGVFVDCEGICGGPAEIDECNICNGNGIDFDEDGICDDVDDCIGNIYDECGICNGIGFDADNDGLCDNVDTDGDGFIDDSCIDIDNDLTCDHFDLCIDLNGDGICDDYYLNFDFDGENVDYVQGIEISQSLIVEDQLSISAWIYPTLESGGNKRIFTMYSISGDQDGQHYSLLLDSFNRIYFLGDNNDFEDGGEIFGSTPVNLYEWNHVAITYDGLVMKFFLNGNLDLERMIGTVDNPVLFTTEVEEAGYFRIGSKIDNEERFLGSIDEITVWDFAVDDEFINVLMYDDIQTSEGLLGYWDFNSGYGNILFDNTSNQNNGLIYNATWPYDNSSLDCSGELFIPIINNAFFVQLKESENCYEYSVFGPSLNDISNSNIGIDDFIYVRDIAGSENYNYAGEGEFRINDYIEVEAYANIKVLKDNSDFVTDCLEENYSVLIPQTTFTISQVLNGVDFCGECGGDDSTCSDCAGIPYGENMEDMCGECDLDISNDCIQDCAENWGGNTEFDDCFVCGGDNDCIYSTNEFSINDIFVGDWIASMQQTWPNLNCEGEFEIDTDFEAYAFYDDGVAVHYDYYSEQDYLHIENEFWGYLYDEDNDIDMLCIFNEDATELNIYEIECYNYSFEDGILHLLGYDYNSLDDGECEMFVLEQGCLDDDACTFSEYGECIYAEEFYDCFGECALGYDCYYLTEDLPLCGNYDECFVCTGGNTGFYFNQFLDCDGVCFGEAELDDCDVCGGDNTSCDVIGDINIDGIINVLDIVLVVNIVLNTEDYNFLADLNEDGINNILDIVLLVNLVLYGAADELECGDTVELFGQVYDVATTTYLDFQNDGIEAEIPSEIGCLINLEELDLEDNQLYGEIPPELGNLVNLLYLDLENNQLIGDIPDTVKELILHINSIGGYTSLIENELNEDDWINENACGDCEWICNDLTGTWIMDTYNACGNGIEEADEGEYFIFNSWEENSLGGWYEQISNTLVTEEGYYECHNGNIVTFSPLNSDTHYGAHCLITLNTLTLEILVGDDECTEVILNFIRQE